MLVRLTLLVAHIVFLLLNHNRVCFLDSSCRETAFQEIFKLLKHPYATVRVAASESLYLTLIAQDEEAFTKFEDSEGKTVLDLLDATPWPSNNSSVIADAVQRISHCTGF
mmetsp:Transcript_22471/g.55685  ORF Transcript_22471/g.55685 Transcript_22471/m.55685 type:complete len:110 (+) Transcript_22471:2417-2746(+)